MAVRHIESGWADEERKKFLKEREAEEKRKKNDRRN